MVQAGLVFNTAFATILLKEPFTRFSLIGTILTSVGAALIATFGAISEPAHSLPQLIALLSRRKFAIWMVASLVVVVATLILARYYKYLFQSVHDLHTYSKQEQLPAEPRMKSRRRSLSILPHPIQLRASRLRLFRGLSYALVSGILAAHSLLVAKSAVELLVRTVVDHVNQFKSYQSWLILLALIFFALSQLYYLHKGLRLCSTSILYPFVFCIYNVVAILDGLIYFRKVSRLSILHGCLVVLGTVILLSGVLTLSWRLHDPPPAPPEASVAPLGSGLGILDAESENDDNTPSLSPLLPTTRSRSNTLKEASAADPISPADESTPLFFQPRRRTAPIHPRPRESSYNAQQIRAELDDSSTTIDQDVLSSLPRNISPLMSASSLGLKTRHGSRGNSISSIVGPRGTMNAGKSPRPKSMSLDGQRQSSSSHNAQKRFSGELGGSEGAKAAGPGRRTSHRHQASRERPAHRRATSAAASSTTMTSRPPSASLDASNPHDHDGLADSPSTPLISNGSDDHGFNSEVGSPSTRDRGSNTNAATLSRDDTKTRNQLNTTLNWFRRKLNFGDGGRPQQE